MKIGTKGPFSTIKPRIEEIDDRRKFPGPGAYYGQNSTLSLSFKTKYRSASNEELVKKPRNRFNETKYRVNRPEPNVSTYSPNDKFVLPSSSKWIIGTSAKSEFLKEVVERKFQPGPDKYDISPNNKGPYFTLKGKIFHSDNNGVPGPGNYNLDSLFVKVKRSKNGMGYGGRHSYITQNPKIPGPGSYDIDPGVSQTQKNIQMYEVNI